MTHAKITVVAALVVALLCAPAAEAKHSSRARHVDGARALRTGAEPTSAEKRRARHRHRGVARHHAVIRNPGHRGKRRHGAGPDAAGPAGSAPATPVATDPGAPPQSSIGPPAPAPQAEGTASLPQTGSEPPPAGQHGVEVGPEEPEPPPAGQPEPPSGEEPEPPGEEPEAPSGEEPEAPGEEPEPPSPGLLFEGSRIRDFDQVQAAPGAVTEVPDPLGSGETVLQLTVDDGDVAPLTPTENPRAQLVSPDLIEAGDEFWLKTKFLIPQDFPTVTGWMTLLAVYGPPFNASSPWEVELVGDHLQWTRNRTYGFDVPWQAPLIKGTWVTVLTHERFATDGFVEMWIDGQPVSFFGRETRLEMKTMDASNDGGDNSIRIMQYRQAGMFETGTVYFGPVRFGTSRAAVGG